MPTLRAAVVADIPAVVALWDRAAGPTRHAGRERDTVRLLERDPEALIVAVDDHDTIVGTLVVGWDGWRAHLYRLCVEPAARRAGIARTLVDAAARRDGRARRGPARRHGACGQRRRSGILGGRRVHGGRRRPALVAHPGVGTGGRRVSFWDGVIIVIAGMAAGTINTVVGSGSLITFPMLLTLGYPPVLANVSNNIGLVPGAISGVYGYRRELVGQRGRHPPTRAALRRRSTHRRAVAARAAERSVQARGRGADRDRARPGGARSSPVTPARQAARGPRAASRCRLVVLVGLAGIYGGYFGAAQGIILIALLGIFVLDDLQRLNATKNVLAMTVNIVASIVFVFATDVDWAVVACIAAGSVVGGQLGATFGRRLDPRALRVVIVVVGLTALIRLL